MGSRGGGASRAEVAPGEGAIPEPEPQATEGNSVATPAMAQGSNPSGNWDSWWDWLGWGGSNKPNKNNAVGHRRVNPWNLQGQTDAPPPQPFTPFLSGIGGGPDQSPMQGNPFDEFRTDNPQTEHGTTPAPGNPLGGGNGGAPNMTFQGYSAVPQGQTYGPGMAAPPVGASGAANAQGGSVLGALGGMATVGLAAAAGAAATGGYRKVAGFRARRGERGKESMASRGGGYGGGAISQNGSVNATGSGRGPATTTNVGNAPPFGMGMTPGQQAVVDNVASSTAAPFAPIPLAPIVQSRPRDSTPYQFGLGRDRNARHRHGMIPPYNVYQGRKELYSPGHPFYRMRRVNDMGNRRHAEYSRMERGGHRRKHRSSESKRRHDEKNEKRAKKDRKDKKEKKDKKDKKEKRDKKDRDEKNTRSGLRVQTRISRNGDKIKRVLGSKKHRSESPIRNRGAEEDSDTVGKRRVISLSPSRESSGSRSSEKRKKREKEEKEEKRKKGSNKKSEKRGKKENKEESEGSSSEDELDDGIIKLESKVDKLFDGKEPILDKLSKMEVPKTYNKRYGETDQELIRLGARHITDVQFVEPKKNAKKAKAKGKSEKGKEESGEESDSTEDSDAPPKKSLIKKQEPPKKRGVIHKAQAARHSKNSDAMFKLPDILKDSDDEGSAEENEDDESDEESDEESS
jgi:hypothetical protein